MARTNVFSGTKTGGRSENAIEHAFVVCPGGTILPHHLPRQFAPIVNGDVGDVAETTLRSTEITAIRRALQTYDNNRTAAAKALGIHKSTLHRKLRRYGIVNPSRDNEQ